MTFRDVPINDVRPSDTNPRRVWGDLDGLVKNIKAVGILQPLVVRETPTGLVIVAGHRRHKAALEAGLATVPVRIAQLDDIQALEAQVAENLQRENLVALDEAHAYQQLLEASGSTVPELAQRLGVSRTIMYDRLKLCSLVGTACVEAINAGKLNASTALLLARLPAALQDEALVAITWEATAEIMSYREARAELARRYHLSLSGAPFDPKADLPIAWAVADEKGQGLSGTCGPCPRRSGNIADLTAEVGPDVCTDVLCYRGKSDHAWQARRDAHRAKGGAVLEDATQVASMFPFTGRALDPKAPWVDLDTISMEDAKGRTYRKILGKQAATTLVRDPSGHPHELLPKRGLRNLLREKGVIREPQPDEQPDAAAQLLEQVLAKVRSSRKGPSGLLEMMLRLACLGAPNVASAIITGRGWAQDQPDPEVIVRGARGMASSQAWGLLAELICGDMGVEDLERALVLVGARDA